MRTLLKLTWVELKLFFREPITLVFTFALPVIFLVVMGGVFGNTPDPEGKIYRGVGALSYYVPAYIGLVLSSIGVVAIIGVVAMPVHLTAYRERRILRRLRASSISVWSVLGSQVIVSFIIAVLGSILLVIVSGLAYGTELPKMPLLVVPAFILTTLCFSTFGFFLGAILPNARAAQGLGIILFFLMLMLGGAGPPMEVLPQSMRLIGSVMPARYVILVLQDPWLGFGWHTSASLVVAGITIVAALLSVRFFRWD